MGRPAKSRFMRGVDRLLGAEIRQIPLRRTASGTQSGTEEAATPKRGGRLEHRRRVIPLPSAVAS